MPVIKSVYRLCRYRNERKKFVREFSIRKKQDVELRKRYDLNISKLIVFIVPGSDWATGRDKISGGTMSIVSICEESSQMKKIHNAETIMCTLNRDHLLLRHQMFENNTPVFRFNQLAKNFQHCSEILFHLPEFLVKEFYPSLTTADKRWLDKMDLVHMNIMNQNIQLMPAPSIIHSLHDFADKVTVTTAHQKYCTVNFRKQYNVPVHKLSVWISPEQYMFRKWEQKDNLLVVSPDKHPRKDEILQELSKLKDLKIQIIQNLTYTEYKELVSRAKWSITFGEGLDGYLIEPVFSGAVGFAVYNEDFFTPDFGELKTIYPSMDALKQRILTDIRNLDNNIAFAEYQQKQFALCAKYYSKEQYRKNIGLFYSGQYTIQ